MVCASTPSSRENTTSLMFRDMRSVQDIRYFDINSSYISQLSAKHDAPYTSSIVALLFYNIYSKSFIYSMVVVESL